MPYEFDGATAVRADGAGRWSVDVAEGWDIRGNANGGYVMSLLAAAMRAEVERPDPVSITVHYLAPLAPGPASIATDVVKRGRRLATVTASLVHGGRESARAIASFGEVGAGSEQAPFAHLGIAPPDLPPPDECRRRSPKEGGVPLALMDRLDLRLHPDDTGFVTGSPPGRAEARGWFAFADGRPIDALSVLLACDAFPPPLFNLIGVPGWVPTIELTVHLRARPSGGPLQCRFVTDSLHGGTFVEDGAVWDGDGTLVAMSRQVGLIAG